MAEQETFDKAKVLARIKKMMALAHDAGASEGERDNALRMAHAYLAKYNLTMSEAEAVGTKTEEARSVDKTLMGRDYPWMRLVAFAIGQLFFCEYFYTSLRGGKVLHCFVGKGSNVFTAQEMTKYVIDSIDREAKRMQKERFGDGSYWRSFCKGASYRINDRCKKIRADAEKAPAASTGTALVLASVYASEKKANQLVIAQQVGELDKSKSRERNTDWSAASDGAKFGDRVSLNNQVGGPSGGNKQLK